MNTPTPGPRFWPLYALSLLAGGLGGLSYWFSGATRYTQVDTVSSVLPASLGLPWAPSLSALPWHGWLGVFPVALGITLNCLLLGYCVHRGARHGWAWLLAALVAPHAWQAALIVATRRLPALSDTPAGAMLLIISSVALGGICFRNAWPRAAPYYGLLGFYLVATLVATIFFGLSFSCSYYNECLS